MPHSYFRMGDLPGPFALIRMSTGMPGQPKYAYLARHTGRWVADYDVGRSIWNGDADAISAAEAAELAPRLLGGRAYNEGNKLILDFTPHLPE